MSMDKISLAKPQRQNIKIMHIINEHGYGRRRHKKHVKSSYWEALFVTKSGLGRFLFHKRSSQKITLVEADWESNDRFNGWDYAGIRIFCMEKTGNR
jgi:hypothetical protein